MPTATVLSASAYTRLFCNRVFFFCWL